MGDDFEDFPRHGGKWWRSCILLPVFHKFRHSRNRRRSRVGNARRGIRHSDSYNSNSDGNSVASVEFPDYRGAEIDEEITSSNSPLGDSSGHRRFALPSLYTAKIGLTKCFCSARWLHSIIFVYEYLEHPHV